MISPNEYGQHEKAINQPGGMVIELVGIAGTGKSTLFRALKKKEPDYIYEHVPFVRDLSNSRFYVKNILSLIPVLIPVLGKGNRFLSRHELICMALLNGWWEDLRREKASTGGKSVVLDQGPISIMAYLQIKGSPSLKYSNIQRWWDKVDQQWTQTIDLVIWLDNPYETSIYRINNRPQNHILKGKSEQVARTELTKYRVKYEEILSKFTSNNPKLHVVHLTSDNNSVDEIAEIVLSEVKALM